MTAPIQPTPLNRGRVYQALLRRGATPEEANAYLDAQLGPSASSQVQFESSGRESLPLDETIVGGVATAARGATLGIPEKLINVIQAKAGQAEGESFRDAFQRVRRGQNAATKAFASEHPLAAAGLEVAGGIPAIMATGGAGAVGQAKNLSILSRIARGAREGTKFGALAGVGQAEGDLGEHAAAAVGGAAAGGVVGGALPAIGSALGRVADLTGVSGVIRRMRGRGQAVPVESGATRPPTGAGAPTPTPTPPPASAGAAPAATGTALVKQPVMTNMGSTPSGSSTFDFDVGGQLVKVKGRMKGDQFFIEALESGEGRESVGTGAMKNILTTIKGATGAVTVGGERVFKNTANKRVNARVVGGGPAQDAPTWLGSANPQWQSADELVNAARYGDRADQARFRRALRENEDLALKAEEQIVDIQRAAREAGDAMEAAVNPGGTSPIVVSDTVEDLVKEAPPIFRKFLDDARAELQDLGRDAGSTGGQPTLESLAYTLRTLRDRVNTRFESGGSRATVAPVLDKFAKQLQDAIAEVSPEYGAAAKRYAEVQDALDEVIRLTGAKLRKRSRTYHINPATPAREGVSTPLARALASPFSPSAAVSAGIETLRRVGTAASRQSERDLAEQLLQRGKAGRDAVERARRELVERQRRQFRRAERAGRAGGLGAGGLLASILEEQQ